MWLDSEIFPSCSQLCVSYSSQSNQIFRVLITVVMTSSLDGGGGVPVPVTTSSPEAGSGVPVWVSSVTVTGGITIAAIAIMATILSVDEANSNLAVITK